MGEARVTTGGDRVVPNDELTDEEKTALGWAVSAEHPTAMKIVERVRGGGTGVTVMELEVVREDWVAAGRPVPEHHVHRTPVTFADGTTVVGVTFVADGPYVRDVDPRFGLYLDERWQPPWEHSHVDWPDFGIPNDLDALREALVNLLDRARSGDSVEIGCLGGHGRTGTALAWLAVATGTHPEDAVDWVRANYCKKAIETDEQRALVEHFKP